jgi:D-glycero-D-manno-heptose 1,7-bisphosphate phosphatase
VSAPGVFLDRDGVIVELVWDELDRRLEAPNSPGDVRLATGAAEAIRTFRSAGFRTVVVSNQGAAAKLKVTRADLADTHERVVQLLADQGAEIDDYRYCLHHPEGLDTELAVVCACRKPAPGMLLAAAAELDIDLAVSWMIGDSDLDVEAGRRAGCRTILVENPGSAHRRVDDVVPNHRVPTVEHAVRIVAP